MEADMMIVFRDPTVRDRLALFEKAHKQVVHTVLMKPVDNGFYTVSLKADGVTENGHDSETGELILTGVVWGA